MKKYNVVIDWAVQTNHTVYAETLEEAQDLAREGNGITDEYWSHEEYNETTEIEE